MDTLRFDTHKLSRRAARIGLLRGEVAQKAGISVVTGCNALLGRPVGVRTARNIAQVLNVKLADLLEDDPEPIDETEPVAVSA